MSVEQDVYGKDKDNGTEEGGHGLKNRVALRLEAPVVPAVHLLEYLLIQHEHQHHAAGRYKKHVGLTKGIKGPVGKNHTAHNINCTGLLHTILDISSCYLIGGCIVCISDLRKVAYGID